MEVIPDEPKTKQIDIAGFNLNDFGASDEDDEENEPVDDGNSQMMDPIDDDIPDDVEMYQNVEEEIIDV